MTISTTGLENSNNLPKFPLLIVPNNNYNRNVPVLLGTNVLQYLLVDVQKQYGTNFLQKAKMFTPWYLTFRTMVLKQRELRRNNNRLGIIKSAENHCVLIPPNTSITISGYVDKGIPYHLTTALLHSTIYSSIPSDLEIAPTLINYQYPKKNLVKVYIDNVTTRTVYLQPKSVLCEIQPVTVESTKCFQQNIEKLEYTDLLQTLKNENENFSFDQIEQCTELIRKFSDVFSKSETDIGQTSVVKHKIELLDPEPFKQKNRKKYLHQC